MAALHRLQPHKAGPSLAEAVTAFCDTLEAWATRRVYAGTLHGLLAELGPAFLTERRARLPLAPGDLDLAGGGVRLSYRRAAELFAQHTNGWILRQLRHSALTHAAEAGVNTSTLMAYSGHTSVASLARYTRVSPEPLSRWQAGRDPATRRR